MAAEPGPEAQATGSNPQTRRAPIWGQAQGVYLTRKYKRTPVAILITIMYTCLIACVAGGKGAAQTRHSGDQKVDT